MRTTQITNSKRTSDDAFEDLKRQLQSNAQAHEHVFSKKREKLGSMSTKWQFRAKVIMRNSLLRRIIGLCAVTCIYSAFLRLFVGQQMALDRVKYAAKLIEYGGYLTVGSSNMAFVDMMNTFDAVTPAATAELNLRLEKKLNGTYWIEDIEETYQRTMHDLSDLSI
jgi:hypothetical protein